MGNKIKTLIEKCKKAYDDSIIVYEKFLMKYPEYAEKDCLYETPYESALRKIHEMAKSETEKNRIIEIIRN